MGLLKPFVTSALFFAAFLSPATEISMGGLKIGDSKNSLDKIKLKVVGKDDDMIKFLTTNGNHLSVTLQKGKIVYMENDWLQDPKASQSLFSDLRFGQTTLREIRKKMGTNGFAYSSRSGFTTNGYEIEFNCFEFNSPNHEILITITKVPTTAKLTEANVADHLKLDAIIIADESYCDSQWGSEKSYDKNYKKINP